MTRWHILKFEYEGETTYKLLRGFSGGYLDGDSWALNSGITKIETTVRDNYTVYDVYGVSGSRYPVFAEAEGLSSIMASQLNYWQTQYAEIATIEISSVEEYLASEEA